ncbi:YtxH domain-containing protein [Paenibacillus cymbidii]|uniref:YtxH domain-containing protein n=1 Tax=Paenibacillus cymbidii TaxID=1639034 RepID=UPI0010809460|nr:YtxH domain-containing protein [Paenibacillus cymbidii]
MAKRNGKDLLVGAVIGSAVGAITALLFAPKSGKELRGDIAEQVRAAADKTQQLAGQVSDKTQQVAKQVGAQTSDWVGKIKSWRGGKEEELQEETEAEPAHLNGAALLGDDASLLAEDIEAASDEDGETVSSH